MLRTFMQVDVFATTAYRGNPVAVVLESDGLSDEQMQRFARWVNLSETTYLLPPASPEADYRVRIFTRPGNCRSPVIPRSAPATRGWRMAGRPVTPGRSFRSALQA